MSAILSWSRSDIFSSKAFMGAGSTFSGKSPMSRSAFDALSRYCNGDLTATSAMPASCERQIQGVHSPFATAMAGRWPDETVRALLRGRCGGRRLPTRHRSLLGRQQFLQCCRDLRKLVLLRRHLRRRVLSWRSLCSQGRTDHFIEKSHLEVLLE